MVQRKSALMVAIYALANQPFNLAMAQTSNPEAGSEWLCTAAEISENPSEAWHCEPQAHTRNATKTRNASILPFQAHLDWVPQEKLSETQKAALPYGCCGAYVEPLRTDEDANTPPSEAPLRGSANQSELIDNKDAILSGEVLFTKGRQTVKADAVKINRSTHQASLEGNVSVREPGLLMLAERATLNTEDNSAELEQAEFVIHENGILGSAKRLSVDSNSVLTLEDGTYTQCEPENNAWLLSGDEIIIDPNTSRAQARNVTLKIKGVPVLYSPYMSFPIGGNRQSGILAPTLGHGSVNGLDFSVPYYLNLAPNYDATLTPRYIAERGTGLEAEFRHLGPQFTSQLSMAFLGNDDGGDNSDRQVLFQQGLIEADEVRPHEGEDRWLINLTQTGRLSSKWSTLIDYTQVSDLDYFRDLGATSLDVNSSTHLKRLLQARYRSGAWSYTIRTEDYQPLISSLSRAYRQVPSLEANGDYKFGDVSLSLHHKYTRFDHADKFSNNNNSVTGKPIITGQRGRMEYRLAWEKEWIWGHFKPAAMAKGLNYNLDSEGLAAGDNTSPDIFAPQASLDMGLVFERQGELFGGYTQTFEPRLFYFYSDLDDHSELYNLGDGNQFIDFDTAEPAFTYNQLYRDSRFSGGDRIDDANHLAVGMSTRFVNNATGSERLRASLGQIHYFENRQVTLTGEESINTKSELAMQVAGQLNSNWRLSGDLLYDEDDQTLSKGSFSAHYLDSDYRIFNLSYRYTRKPEAVDTSDFDMDGDITELNDRDVEQVDTSIVWPLNFGRGGNWNAIARYNYDFTYKRNLETLLGLEYNSCCYRIRLVGRRWLDNDLINSNPEFALDLKHDEGIFFEFELIGLGGTGQRILKTLTEGIAGYESREQRFQR